MIDRDEMTEPRRQKNPSKAFVFYPAESWKLSVAPEVLVTFVHNQTKLSAPTSSGKTSELLNGITSNFATETDNRNLFDYIRNHADTEPGKDRRSCLGIIGAALSETPEVFAELERDVFG